MTEPAVGASTCASGSQVWTGHIGILTAKLAKKASHSQVCICGGKCTPFSKRRDVGGAGVPVHAHDREQHQHRADEGIEEEFEAGIDAPLAAPDADDQEHRDQAALEQHIEQHQIQGAEHPDHHGLQDQEGDHIFGDAGLDGVPAGGDAEGHQAGGEDHEQHGNPVHAHVIGNAAAQPVHFLDKLEAGIVRIESHPHQTATGRM